MINQALTHRLRKILPCLLVITLTALVGPAISPVWGGATWHNIPGTACAAFNNNQANKLERNHVRLYNPPTNFQSVWVVCPIQRVVEDITSTTSPVDGYINAYFDTQSATNATVTCAIREFEYTTTHVPGGTTNGVINIEVVTAIRPNPFSPSVSSSYWTFTNNVNFLFNHWTVTCKLAPGTGINSIHINQH